MGVINIIIRAQTVQKNQFCVEENRGSCELLSRIRMIENANYVDMFSLWKWMVRNLASRDASGDKWNFLIVFGVYW